jgi:4-hydroxybenzoate polyprenyltransferase
MARALGAADWLVLAVLIIIAGIIIYFLTPLAVVIAIVAAAYFIYRWYTGRQTISV